MCGKGIWKETFYKHLKILTRFADLPEIKQLPIHHEDIHTLPRSHRFSSKCSGLTYLPSSCWEVGGASPKIPKTIHAIATTLSCTLEWTLLLKKKHTLVPGLGEIKLVLLEAYSLLASS